ncbi:unnamed protein product, partial [Adineta steineri]
AILVGCICDYYDGTVENRHKKIKSLVNEFSSQRTAYHTTNYSSWNIEFFSDSKSILIAECPSLCQKKPINPIATTPSSTIQLSRDEFQSEMANQIHSSSEPVQYNPQLDTIITLEPNK